MGRARGHSGLVSLPSSPALDCQQPLWPGLLPQRGGAPAPEQRQHRLHPTGRPLHLRCLLGESPPSPCLGPRQESPGRGLQLWPGSQGPREGAPWAQLASPTKWRRTQVPHWPGAHPVPNAVSHLPLSGWPWQGWLMLSNGPARALSGEDRGCCGLHTLATQP